VGSHRKEYRKNLYKGISREFQKNFREYCMHFWYLGHIRNSDEIPGKFLQQFLNVATTSHTGLLATEGTYYCTRDNDGEDAGPLVVDKPTNVITGKAVAVRNEFCS
jgi:hypothetical protein